MFTYLLLMAHAAPGPVVVTAPNKQICRGAVITGSRAKREKKCKTAEEWRAASERSRQAVSDGGQLERARQAGCADARFKTC